MSEAPRKRGDVSDEDNIIIQFERQRSYEFPIEELLAADRTHLFPGEDTSASKDDMSLEKSLVSVFTSKTQTIEVEVNDGKDDKHIIIQYLSKLSWNGLPEVPVHRVTIQGSLTVQSTGGNFIKICSINTNLVEVALIAESYYAFAYKGDMILRRAALHSIVIKRLANVKELKPVKVEGKTLFDAKPELKEYAENNYPCTFSNVLIQENHGRIMYRSIKLTYDGKKSRLADKKSILYIKDLRMSGPMSVVSIVPAEDFAKLNLDKKSP